jgi:hypothetical protein
MTIDRYTKSLLTVGVVALIAIAANNWSLAARWPKALHTGAAEAQQSGPGCPATSSRNIRPDLKLVTSVTYRGTVALVFEDANALWLIHVAALTEQLREGTAECPFLRINRG